MRPQRHGLRWLFVTSGLLLLAGAGFTLRTAVTSAVVAQSQPPGDEPEPPPPSLKTVRPKYGDGLDNIVTDRAALRVLGKALYWDMQVGSDGVRRAPAVTSMPARTTG